MKTLDEVIDAMERCSIPHYFDCKGCPYEDDDAEVGCRSDERDADALHYLRELRDMTDIPMEYFEYGGTSQKLRNTSQITCPKCHSEFVILPEANNPLTWDELKQMVGKPVWVHLFGSGLGEWNLIHAQLDNQIWFTDGNGYIYDMHEEKQGITWQAYRKERE